MGFDGHNSDFAAEDRVEEWMSALHPTRDKPTALKYGDITVIYWRENGSWIAREFGRPDLLPISEKLARAIEVDQEHARQKLLE